MSAAAHRSVGASSPPTPHEPNESVLPGFYMTLREAAERVGLSGRAGEMRVRRILFERERALGRQIALRRLGKGRPRVLITLPLLEQFCPELFSKRVQLTEELRQEVERLEEQIGVLKSQNLRLAEEVSKVRAATSAPRGGVPAAKPMKR